MHLSITQHVCQNSNQDQSSSEEYISAVNFPLSGGASAPPTTSQEPQIQDMGCFSHQLGACFCLFLSSIMAMLWAASTVRAFQRHFYALLDDEEYWRTVGPNQSRAKQMRFKEGESIVSRRQGGADSALPPPPRPMMPPPSLPTMNLAQGPSRPAQMMLDPRTGQPMPPVAGNRPGFNLPSSGGPGFPPHM